MEYDNYQKVLQDKCNHTFVKSTTIIRQYSPDLCDKVIEHGRKGLFIEGFSGRYNVCTDAICDWLSKQEDYPDFNSAVKVSISACIHFWNEELNNSIANTDWSAVVAIKGILTEIMKSTPKQLREGLFNGLQVKTADEMAQQKQLKDENELFKLTTGM